MAVVVALFYAAVQVVVAVIHCGTAGKVGEVPRMVFHSASLSCRRTLEQEEHTNQLVTVVCACSYSLNDE